MGRRRKIIRLPHELRGEINQPLWNGQTGREIVAWLNGLEPVRAVMKAEFASKAVRGQTLWKCQHAGYQDWLDKREAAAAVREMAGGKSPRWMPTVSLEASAASQSPT